MCLCVCKHTHVPMYVCMCINMHTYMSEYLHECMCACTHMCATPCVSEYDCVPMYVESVSPSV